MTKCILIAGTHAGIGLTSTVMGVYHALDRKGINVAYFKPVLQNNGPNKQDNSFELMKNFAKGEVDKLSVDQQTVIDAVNERKLDELMEQIIHNYDSFKASADIVIMEGLIETDRVPYANEVNQRIVQALSADVVIVGSAKVANAEELLNQINVVVDEFGGYQNEALLGAIINYVNASDGLIQSKVEELPCFNDAFNLIGCVRENFDISAARASDLASHLKAQIVFAGEMETRRVFDYVMFARTVPNATQYLQAGNCIFCPGDRDDALMAITIAAIAGTKLACLVLTGPLEPSKTVLALCMPLLEKSQIPIFHIDTNSWGVVDLMAGFNQFIYPGDEMRRVKTQEHFADHLNWQGFDSYFKSNPEKRLSPASFRYEITKQAISADKRIVLPEGDEPRTVMAAVEVAQRKMAQCVLLANREKVFEVAKQNGIEYLPDSIKIIDPDEVRSNYIERLVALRAHKGMTEVLAKEQLKDNVMLGTLMLEAGEVDGLVSGAVHTTANTMRPPLQIIKTAENSSMVSSVFFMCLPDSVMVYGDCAIVPKPNAAELAEIAIQSNDTAKAFGIEPKVAVISYSTGDSGQGEEVEKVKEATRIVKEKRPDILVDGPLQYDAAAVPSVGMQKAPNSTVAGKATVFIFPDLNTGNTTYKAVQRSAKAISMGPVLQGMRKPVNDLSRGALVEDIIYTIAITAIQASQNEGK